MKIEINNNQLKHRIQPAGLRKFLRHLTAQAAPADNSAWSEISLVLTDDPAITLLNKQYFGKDCPTDVISFRYDPLPGDEARPSGEIIVNVDQASREGAAREGFEWELALYIAHGWDHLTGGTDETPDKRRRMLARERKWLKEAQDSGYLQQLVHIEE
ncbi:MAG: rRNA maturation RNase YbeY [Verrucomicrobia bacterium]|nr:rRNA maturation RNase YbeY [Verrucomicrobiota bacterium]